MRISDWSSDVCSSDQEMTVETVLNDRWMVAVPSSDPFARRERATFKMLAERPLCFCQREITQGLFDDTLRHLADNDVRNPTLRAVRSLMSVLNLVSIGEGQSGRASCGERVCQYG